MNFTKYKYLFAITALVMGSLIYCSEEPRGLVLPKELFNRAQDTTIAMIAGANQILNGFKDDEGINHPGFRDSFPYIAQHGLTKTGDGLSDVALGLGHIGTLGDGLSDLSVAFAGPQPKKQENSHHSASAVAPSADEEEKKHDGPRAGIYTPSRLAPQVPSMSREHLPISHAIKDASQNLIEVSKHLKPLEVNAHTATRLAGVGIAGVSAYQLAGQCGPCCSAALLTGGLCCAYNAHNIEHAISKTKKYTKKLATNCLVGTLMAAQAIDNIKYPRAKAAGAALATGALAAGYSQGLSVPGVVGFFALGNAAGFAITNAAAIDKKLGGKTHKVKKD